MSENQPSYYAIIPANVRYCKDLEPSAKLLYGEITALCNKEGYCWAGDQYFADLYQVDPRTIKRWIDSLKTMLFISTESFNDGFKRKRRIYIGELKKSLPSDKNVPSDENVTFEGDKNVPSVSGENVPSYIRKNNTSSNNTSDDDDRVREAEDEFFITKDSKGREKSNSIFEFTKYLKGCKYSDETIKEAIKRTQTFPDPISNALRFVDSICIQIEAQNAKESKPKTSKKQKETFSPRTVIQDKTVTWEEFQKNKKQGK